MSSSSFSSKFKDYLEPSRTKYVVAATLITIGGCYLVFKAYEQQQTSQAIDNGAITTNANAASTRILTDDEKADVAMTSLVSGANSIAQFDASQSQAPPTQGAESFPIKVFLRMRPLVGKEVSQKHTKLEYDLTRQSSSAKKSTKKAASTANGNETKMEELLTLKNVSGRDMKDSKQYKGFGNILLPIHNNFDTFNTCILPSLTNILSGQATCVFAYGHTGSGKTHTIFGYGTSDPGMYQLYARALFRHLQKKGTGNQDGDSTEEKKKNEFDDVMVEVRFTELYDTKLRDLLSPTKEECFVRVDQQDNVHIRSTPIKSEKDGKLRQFPITGIHCKSEAKLMSVVKEGVKSRNVGLSTLHDKSSRSHAFLEYEIVTRELIKQRRKLIDIEADILNWELALQTDKVRICKDKQKVILGKMKNIMNDPKRPYIGGTMVFVDLAGNEYGRDVALLSDEIALAEKAQDEHDGNVDEATKQARIEAAAAKAAQDKKQFMQEQKERNQINQSLLALKECIRALHANKKHVGYRNSTLTKYLSQYLKANTSKAIMISNVGSSNKYAKQTINTLKYTQLVANA